MCEIIAHRGASYDAPENTIGSVRLAWQQQADAVEIDCWLTGDGQIVVIHDADTRRVTGSPLRVAETAWSVLRELDCGSWKGPQWDGERLPLLADVINAVPPGKRLYVDVKCGVEIMTALASHVALASRAAVELVIICFDEAVVGAFKRQFPTLRALLLGNTPQPAEPVDFGPNWLEELLDAAGRTGADGLDLQAGPAVDRQLIERAERAGLPCIVWTVDNAREAGRLRDAGVRGITTNRPAWLREKLKE